MRHLLLAAALAALTSPAFGQDSTLTVQPQPQQGAVLRAGTPVTLRTLSNLTTKGKHLKVGDRFSLEVSDPVSLNGQVVIPVGSNAVGEITSVRNKGMWGKSGNIETRLLYITTNDRRIRLSGSVGDKGVKAGGGAIATSAVVFLPAGFFMTGTSAVIPLGTVVKGIIDEDIPIAFASAPAQPMIIQSSAPTAPTSPAMASATSPSPAVLPEGAKAVEQSNKQ